MKWDKHNKGTSINSQLQHQLQSQQEKARNCLLKIFTSIKYLARQGLPPRGNLEHNGNFHQLMQLRPNDFDDLKDWLQQKKAYTFHEIQDEMLKIMSHQIQRLILKDVYTSKRYNVSADETVNASLTEQVYIKSFIHTRFLKCQTIFYHTFFFSSLSFALGTSAQKHMKFMKIV